MSSAVPIAALKTASANLQWTDASGTLASLAFDLVEDEQWDGGATVTDYPVENTPDVTDNVRVQPRRCSLKVFVTNEPIYSNQFATATLTPLALALKSPSFKPQSPNLVSYQVWQNNLLLHTALATAAGLIGGAAAGPVGGAVGAIAGELAAGALIPGVKVPRVFPLPPRTAPALPAPPSVQSWQFVDGVGAGQDFVQLTLELLDWLLDNAQLITVNGSKRVVTNMVIEKLSDHRSSETGTGAEITIGLKQIFMVSTGTVPTPALPQAAATVNHGAQNTSDASDSQNESVLAAGADGIDVDDDGSDDGGGS